MAFDFAPEFGVPFILQSMDTTEMAAFNLDGHPDNVGVLTDISGLDSAEVRESGDTLAEFDGGVQGPNYYGRRPIVLEGLVYGHADPAERSAKLAKLMRVTNAMRSDCVLSWTPSGMDESVFLALRRQQPLRIAGGWNKTFQAAMVAADPRIYSSASYFLVTDQALDALSPINQGSTETFPKYTIAGPALNPTIHNSLSGRNISMNVNLAFEDVIYIDTLNRTVMRGQRLPGSRTNYYPNPSFETATHGFSTITFGALAIVAQPSIGSGLGSQVLRATPTNTTDDMTFTLTDAVPGITSTDVVTFGINHLSSMAPSAGETFNFEMDVIAKDSGGTTIGFPVGFDVIDPSGSLSSPTEWRRWAFVSHALPAGTARVDLRMRLRNEHPAGQVYYFDGMTVEGESTNGEFFDGSHPEDGFVGGWDGTVDASVSRSYTTEADPSVDLTSWYSIVDFAGTRWSGLFPGPNDLTVELDATPGSGFSFRVDWQHAWL